MQDNKESMATFHRVTSIEITRFKRTPGWIDNSEYWITSLKYVLKTVNAFAFTIKLTLVMKGNELELKNNMQLYHGTE